MRRSRRVSLGVSPARQDRALARVLARRARGEVRPEHLEQVQLVGRVRAFYPDVVIYSVPNGAALKSRAHAVRLKAEGLLPGVPDLFVAEPRGRFHGLYVEVKRAKGGRPSREQARLMRQLRERGYAVHLADGGVEAAFRAVCQYLDRGTLPAGVLA